MAFKCSTEEKARDEQSTPFFYPAPRARRAASFWHWWSVFANTGMEGFVERQDIHLARRRPFTLRLIKAGLIAMVSGT